MKHFIIGTAGHIDHGKTSLVIALTGRDPSRLEEEKKRGITIDLGFTYYDDDKTKTRIGIVDVPGHEKFVKNMLAGVHGIDLVLMVIAADEGIMPQTEEHINILDLLGVKKGIIILTKIDMVDEEWVELVKEDIQKYVKGTFLENSEIITVSSKTLEGIDELKNKISNFSESFTDTSSTRSGILPIDRVFTLKGIGTVVTGTQIEGRFEVGEDILIYPEMIPSKIKSIQNHGNDSLDSYAGSRVAINLNKVKKEEISRGSIVSTKDNLLVSNFIDVKLKLLENSLYKIKNKSKVRFYIYSSETFATINLLDRDELLPGEECYAQFKLEDSLSLRRKDKFIIRFLSPVITIGGGEILEVNSNRKKRYKENNLDNFYLKDSDQKDSLLGILKDHESKLFSVDEIGLKLNITIEDAKKLIDELVNDNNIKLIGNDKIILISTLNEVISNISNTLDDFHKNNPLKEGIPVEEIKNKFLSKFDKSVDYILELIIQNSNLIVENNYVKNKEFRISLSEKDLQIKEKIISQFIEKRSYKKQELDANIDMLYLLSKKGFLYLIGDEFITKELYDEALMKLNEFFKNEEKIDAKTFRDLLDTNRKTAIGLLEYFDNKKITKRNGDFRILVKGDLS